MKDIIAHLTQTQVSQLYVSIFGRASEGAGNTYWQTSTYSADMATAANKMLATSAAATYFGTSLDDNAAFIKHIYLNALGKTYEQDTRGVDYWVGELAAGKSRGEVVNALIVAAQLPVNAGAAQDMFINKVAVSDYCADNIATAGSDLSAFQSYISSVTSDAATVTAAKAVVDAANPANVGQTFTLTTGVDDLKGTDNADLFKAVNSSIISEGTLQGGDKIDGGAGNDTLKVDMKKNFDGFTTGSMKNVEKVELTNSSNADLTFKASKVEGVTKYVVTDAVDKNTTISDVASLADIEISGTADTANTKLSVAYATTSTVATGTQTDVQNLKVTNQGSINTKTDGTTNAKFMTVDIDKVETLAITTAGTANSLNLSDSADVKTITVTGEGQTEIEAVGTATTSFDASAATGKVIANLSGAAAGALTSVKGGSGDDTLTVSAADMKINATVAGGAGADKLVLDASAGATLALNMSGVETLDAKTTSLLTFSGSNVTDLATVNLIGAVNASFLNMGTNASTVNTTGNSAGTVGFDTAAAVTYNMNASAAQITAGTTAATAAAATTFSGATALTVNANELVASSGAIIANAATSLTINNASKVVNAVELNQFSSKVTAGEATSVTVNSTGTLATGAEIVAAKATSMTLNTGSTVTSTDVIKIDATKLSSLTVNAKQGLTITESAATSLDSIQTLNVTTDKAFELVGSSVVTTILEDIATATVGGTATTSSASLKDLGNANMTHNINLTATGLKAGLTIGTVNAGTGSATLNVSGVTGAVATGTTIAGDAGVTLTATNIAEALTGTATITSKGNISVDVTNAAKAVTLGALNAGTTGDVTVLANNIGGVLTVGAITGNNVTVNTKGAGAAVVNGGSNLTAKTSVNYTAADLFNDNVAIAAGTGSTALAVALAGGAMNETFTIAGTTTQTGITVTGNLGAGTNKVTTTLVDSTSTTGQTVNLSGLTSTATAGDATQETETIISAAVVGLDVVSVTGSVKDDLITLNGAATTTYNQAITITDATSTDLDVLAIGTNASQVYTNLNLTGIEVLTNAAALSINASAISGDTMTTKSAAALTLTGTVGAETINLSNISAYAADGTTAVAAANFIVNADAENDIIQGLKVGGGTYNGDAGNDTIVVTQGINTINGGTGADTMYGGTGADTFVIAADSGSAAGAAAGTFSGYDLITFVTADDAFKGLADGAALDSSGGKQTVTTDKAYVGASAQTVGGGGTAGALVTADFTNIDKVVTYINNVFASTAATDMEFIVAVNDSATGKAAIYYVDNATTDAVVATEVVMLGITTGLVATADFAI